MEKVQIIPPPRDVDPRVLCWKGGAVLGKMDAVTDLWVSRVEWVSFGLLKKNPCEICGRAQKEELGLFFDTLYLGRMPLECVRSRSDHFSYDFCICRLSSSLLLWRLSPLLGLGGWHDRQRPTGRAVCHPCSVFFTGGKKGGKKKPDLRFARKKAMAIWTAFHFVTVQGRLAFKTSFPSLANQ